VENVLKKMKQIFSIRSISIILFVIIIIVALYYIIFPSKGYFTSDSTDTIMWAQATYESGKLISPSFKYACFLPFGGHLLMIPFIAIWGVSMKAHIAGMVVFFILFIGSLFLIFKRLKFNDSTSLLAITVILSLLLGSNKLREMFFGHIIYYSLGLFFLFIGTGIVLKMLESKPSKIFYINAILLYVWCFFTAMNQVPTLTIFTIPLLGAIVGERFFNFTNKVKKEDVIKFIAIIMIIIIATCMGYCATNDIKGNLVAGYQEGYSTFSDPSAWTSNGLKFLTHWTTLIGVDIVEGEPIVNLDGFINIFKIIVSVIFIICPIIITFLYSKINEHGYKIWILIHWILTFLIMIAYVFGNLSAASWRLIPILVTAIITTIILVFWIYNNCIKIRRVILLIVLPIVIVAICNVIEIIKMSYDYGKDSNLYLVYEKLYNNDITYGYATFWQANALTVMSDSKVKCRSINISKNNYEPYYYQQDESWFLEQEGQDEYFVILTEYEYYTMQTSHPLYVNAIARLKLNDYYVFIYDKNIF